MEIVSIKSKALKLLITKNDPRLFQQKYLGKIRAILDVLIEAQTIDDVMAYPYGKPHKLTGNRTGTYAISVYANWRITFVHNAANNTLHILDYEDYH